MAKKRPVAIDVVMRMVRRKTASPPSVESQKNGQRDEIGPRT